MDPLSIAAAALTVIQSISAAYETFRDLKGLPAAFKEVGQNLALVQETLELAHGQLKTSSVDDSSTEAIRSVLQDCKDKAAALEKIFQELDGAKKNNKQGKDWSTFAAFYRKTVLSLGKSHRVETLMQGIMNALKSLAIHQLFKMDSHKHVERLERAVEELSKVEPSLQESEFETSTTSFNQTIATGANGYQFSSVSGGEIGNNWGNMFKSQNMNIGMPVMQGLMKDP